ncbi:hypothetical protein SAMN04488054_1651, partial [Salibacterium qingdaonense]
HKVVHLSAKGGKKDGISGKSRPPYSPRKLFFLWVSEAFPEALMDTLEVTSCSCSSSVVFKEAYLCLRTKIEIKTSPLMFIEGERDTCVSVKVDGILIVIGGFDVWHRLVAVVDVRFSFERVG